MDVERLKISIYRWLPPVWRQRLIRVATPNFSVGVMVMLTDGAGRLLLVRPTYRRGWLPPGGFLDSGESAEQAGRRELREELGVDVQVSAPHRVYLDTERQGVTFVVSARLPEGQVPRLAGPELQRWQWFAVDDLPGQPDDFHEGIWEQDLEAVRRLGQG